jgi:hypothetical protein
MAMPLEGANRRWHRLLTGVVDVLTPDGRPLRRTKWSRSARPAAAALPVNTEEYTYTRRAVRSAHVTVSTFAADVAHRHLANVRRKLLPAKSRPRTLCAWR